MILNRFWVVGGVLALCALVIWAAMAFSNSLLPPAARTGAPGENLCNSCHTGGTNLAGGSLAIQNVPANYTPGQTYAITVQLQRTGQQRWGFELVPIRDSSGVSVMAGQLTATSSTTILQSGFVSGKQRIYVSHSSDTVDGTFFGTANGPVSWTFNWKAPSAGAGGVTFYCAGNAANGDGNSGLGDVIYTATQLSDEAPTTAVTSTTWGKIKSFYLSK